MAPRPRPQHDNIRQSKAQITKRVRPKAIDFLSEPGLAHSTKPHPQKTHHEEGDDDDSSADSDKGEVSEDVDTPRVAQWIDDEEFELNEETDDASANGLEHDDVDDSASEAGPSRRLQSLEDDLSTLPLGALRSAQRSLAQAQTLSDTESDSLEQSEGDFSASEDGDLSRHPVKGKDTEKPDPSSRPKNGPAKRTNKHAPIEVTSKRPVTRRRVVVDDELPKPRDPRFMHVAGRYDPFKFKQQYDFLSGLHNDELSTLREHVKRARKLLVNSPLDLRAAREEEVQRLERAMKKAESAVNQDNRERVEFKALQSVKQAEQEKRKKGKADWWMKRSEKKELLTKARLDAIASAGGKQAVKKALEKKQKKISQKEKKMRPFPRSEGADWSTGEGRRPVGPTDSRGVKRRKVM